MSETHSTVTLSLNSHGMICPGCLEDDSLRVTFTGTCLLTNDGSEDDGDHEWDDDSPCQCSRCNFSAPVSVFRLGDEEEAIDIAFEDPDAEKRSPSFDFRHDVEIDPVFTIVRQNKDGTHVLTLRGQIGLFTWDIESGTFGSLDEANAFDTSLREKYAHILTE